MQIRRFATFKLIYILFYTAGVIGGIILKHLCIYFRQIVYQKSVYCIRSLQYLILVHSFRL